MYEQQASLSKPNCLNESQYNLIHLYQTSSTMHGYFTATAETSNQERSQEAFDQSVDKHQQSSLPAETEDPDRFNLAHSFDATITLASSICQGLRIYEIMLNSDLASGSVPQISVYEIRRVRRVQQVIDVKLRRMRSMRDALYSKKSKGKEIRIFKDGHWAVKTPLVEAHENDKAYIENARAYLINCHVFYKINYACCKDVDIPQTKAP